MGQAANVTNKDTALDTVITNALIIDAVAGIIKADVGIKVCDVCCVANHAILMPRFYYNTIIESWPSLCFAP